MAQLCIVLMVGIAAAALLTLTPRYSARLRGVRWMLLAFAVLMCVYRIAYVPAPGVHLPQ